MENVVTGEIFGINIELRSEFVMKMSVTVEFVVKMHSYGYVVKMCHYG